MSTRLWIGGALIGLILAGCSSNVTTSPGNAPTNAPTNATPTPATPKTAAPKAATSQSAMPKAAMPKDSSSDDSTSVSTTPSKLKTIVWQADYDKARALANKEKKLLLIVFYATWCAPCKVMDEQTFTALNVVQQSTNSVNVKVDIDKNLDIARKYAISPIPALLWVDNAGQEIHRVEGFYPPNAFVQEMKTAQTQFKPLS